MHEKEQCLEKEKRKHQVMDNFFQISHQAINYITCKTIKVMFQRMDKTIAFFFMRTAFPSMLLIHPV